VNTRRKVLVGTVLGAVWAVFVVWAPGRGPQPFIPLNLALIYAFVPGGIVMLLVMGRLAERRFFDDGDALGEPVPRGSSTDIDQRVLTNTMEQMVLALLLWPFAITYLGAVTVIVMGLAMGIARLAFWIGSHGFPGLRAFGFAATFYPTVLATGWSLWRLLT